MSHYERKRIWLAPEKNVLRRKKISHNKARKKLKTIVINETIYSVHLL